MKICSLMLSVHYPNKYHLWTPWNRYANLALSKLNGIDIEVIAPLPFSPPIKYLPYSEFNEIPLIEHCEEGTVHHPRFFYLIPKKIFYGFIGDLYRISVSNYILKKVNKPDIMHAHQIYPDGCGVMDLCKKMSVPLVIEVHSGGSMETWLANSRIKNKIMDVFEFSNRTICISNELSEILRKIGVDSEKIEILHLGVDTDKFKPRNKTLLKKKLDINVDKILLFVGRLDKLKGVYYLLKAISKIKHDFKNLKLIIVGKGPELKNLLELSQKMDLQEIVIFKGELQEEELKNWFSVADLFILPSLTEGKPVVIYEAMASECAVIATNVGGIPDQVKEDFNGFLIEPKNSDLLGDKIEYLLENEDLMRKMGENGRKRLLKEGWTWKGYANRCFEIYSEIIG